MSVPCHHTHDHLHGCARRDYIYSDGRETSIIPLGGAVEAEKVRGPNQNVSYLVSRCEALEAACFSRFLFISRIWRMS